MGSFNKKFFVIGIDPVYQMDNVLELFGMELMGYKETLDGIKRRFNVVAKEFHQTIYQVICVIMSCGT